MTITNGDSTVTQVATLEDQVALLAWLLAEQTYRNIRLATTVAALIAQQIAPTVQESILSQLLGS